MPGAPGAPGGGIPKGGGGMPGCPSGVSLISVSGWCSGVPGGRAIVIPGNPKGGGKALGAIMLGACWPSAA